MRLATTKIPGVWMVAATLVPAVATVIASIPTLRTNPNEEQSFLILAAVSAPLAALVVNLIVPVATSWARGRRAGYLQVPIVPALAYLDVWLENERGYYVGYEYGLSRVVGTALGLVMGVTLMLLVGSFGCLGAQLRMWWDGRPK